MTEFQDVFVCVCNIHHLYKYIFSPRLQELYTKFSAELFSAKLSSLHLFIIKSHIFN